MREKLIELLDSVQDHGFCRSTEEEPQCRVINRIVADHLIANGVIVLPCNVGDTVWYNKAKLQETCLAKVIGIHINYYTPSMPLWVTIEYQSKLIGRQEENMASCVFKLLCHYDREEAEAALKGE